MPSTNRRHTALKAIIVAATLMSVSSSHAITAFSTTDLRQTIIRTGSFIKSEAQHATDMIRAGYQRAQDFIIASTDVLWSQTLTSANLVNGAQGSISYSNAELASSMSTLGSSHCGSVIGSYVLGGTECASDAAINRIVSDQSDRATGGGITPSSSQEERARVVQEALGSDYFRLSEAEQKRALQAPYASGVVEHPQTKRTRLQLEAILSGDEAERLRQLGYSDIDTFLREGSKNLIGTGKRSLQMDEVAATVAYQQLTFPAPALDLNDPIYKTSPDLLIQDLVEVTRNSFASSMMNNNVAQRLADPNTRYSTTETLFEMVDDLNNPRGAYGSLAIETATGNTDGAIKDIANDLRLQIFLSYQEYERALDREMALALLLEKNSQN